MTLIVTQKSHQSLIVWITIPLVSLFFFVFQALKHFEAGMFLQLERKRSKKPICVTRNEKFQTERNIS